MRIMKSVGAVLAGILANFIAVPIDMLMHGTGIFPPMGEDMADSLFVLAFAYRVAAAILGGYVCAYFAPNNSIKHGIVLGCLGIVLSSAGAFVMWDFGHHWYPLALIAISLPCSWFGAKMRSA